MEVTPPRMRMGWKDRMFWGSMTPTEQPLRVAITLYVPTLLVLLLHSTGDGTTDLPGLARLLSSATNRQVGMIGTYSTPVDVRMKHRTLTMGIGSFAQKHGIWDPLP